PSLPLPTASFLPSYPGCPLTWDPVTFWSTYPFNIHDPGSNYKPDYNLVSLSPPVIRSIRCLSTSKAPGTPCAWCATLPHEVEAIRDRTARTFKSSTEERLSPDQLRDNI
ncbi:hypothetical protein R3P38DRAFT_2542042, partial [Favolaschia claudopus]